MQFNVQALQNLGSIYVWHAGWGWRAEVIMGKSFHIAEFCIFKVSFLLISKDEWHNPLP